MLQLKNRSEKYLGKNLTLEFENNQYNYSTQDVLDLLDPRSGFDEESLTAFIEKLSEQRAKKPDGGM